MNVVNRVHVPGYKVHTTLNPSVIISILRVKHQSTRKEEEADAAPDAENLEIQLENDEGGTKTKCHAGKRSADKPQCLWLFGFTAPADVSLLFTRDAEVKEIGQPQGIPPPSPVHKVHASHPLLPTSASAGVPALEGTAMPGKGPSCFWKNQTQLPKEHPCVEQSSYQSSVSKHHPKLLWQSDKAAG